MFFLYSIQRLSENMTHTALQNNVLNTAWRYKSYLLASSDITQINKGIMLGKATEHPYNDEEFTKVMGKNFNQLVSREDRAALFNRKICNPPLEKKT